MLKEEAEKDGTIIHLLWAFIKPMSRNYRGMGRGWICAPNLHDNAKRYYLSFELRRPLFGSSPSVFPVTPTNLNIEPMGYRGLID
jgi:hypothetical protein